MQGGQRPGTPPISTLAKATSYQNIRGGVLADSEMQKVASVASVLVLFFSPAVLIFGLCTRKNVKLDHPAQIIACTIKHSCANF